MNARKPEARRPATPKEEPRIGFPGDAKQRQARIRAAIEANRETLRRLAR